MKERRKLGDYYKWEYTEESDYVEEDFYIKVLIDGEWKYRRYNMTLSLDVPEDECHRVRINNKYYYF